MSVKCKSGFGLYGRLVILRTTKDGITTEIFQDDNIVLNSGKAEAVNWLGNGSSFKISKLAVGNGNNPPETPSEDDSSLVHVLSTKDVTGVNVDIPNRWVTFRASFNSGDPEFAPDPNATNVDPLDPNYDPYNTKFYPEVNEAALVLSDGTTDIYFSKKNFLPRPFESTVNVTLTFIWLVGVV